MKRILTLILISGIILLNSCAPSSLKVTKAYHPTRDIKFDYKIIPKDEVPDKALAIMGERLKAQLADSLHLDGDTNPYQRIEIVITSYYMRHGAARALVGIMAGIDHIVSTVKVIDPYTGESVAEFDIESKNPSAWGSSSGLIEDHIDQIVKYLKN